MNWEKRGLLVEPPLGPPWAATHAALPSVAEAGEGLELYLSARDTDGRAHIGRARLEVVDGSLRAGEVESEPVLGLGKLGAFDDRGVTNSCLVDHGGHRYLYYSGWSLGRSVPFYFYVGLAISGGPGEPFERASPGPILGPNEVDPYLTASPAVLVEDGTWRMWYVSGTGWEQNGGEPVHRYHLKYAESDDGVEWRREGRVAIDYADESEYAIARPCVIRDGGTYRMWFSARGEAYRIGYAESADGYEWERDDSAPGLEPSASGWDSESIEYPWVFDHDGERHMLYNGNGYGATGIGHAVPA